ncbi:putative membrane protein [Raphidiopsis curvata NIES-932]|nr:putative membrane protein [Raphidiopsis curvata NIES-932]
MTFDNLERTIQIGLHIENIHDFSVSEQTYWVEGWYWLLWPQVIQKIIEENKIPLTEIVDITNQVEDESMVMQIEPGKPLDILGDIRYQFFRFSGKLYVDDINLHKSPFQTIVLPITFETRPHQLSCFRGSPDCVYLKPQNNKVDSLRGIFATIPGYEYLGGEVIPYIRKYNTNFGLGDLNNCGAVDFNLIYRSNAISAFSQYVLPLLVIIVVVLASPSLPGSIGDVRLAIPSTALLTMIFLNQSYQAEIPPVAYVTFLNYLYIYAYILSGIFFVFYCWGTHQYVKAPDDKKQSVEKMIDYLDIYFQVGGIITLLVTIPLSWYLS